jgi:DNA-binding SARP family transcriptional activator
VATAVVPVGVRTTSRLRLLGGFGLSTGPMSILLPSDAQRVIAFLAMEPGRLPRAYVAGRLWPEAAQERASGNLRSALWRLRRQAGEVANADTSSVGIAAELTVDVAEVSAAARCLCSTNSECPDLSPDPSVFAQQLLPGWYDDWVVVERERLHQIGLHALEALADRLSRQHRFSSAIEAALTAIRLDSLRESAHRAAIRIHLAEDNPSEALRRYHAYRRHLRAELGLEPSPRMRHLVGHLIDRRPQGAD